MELIVQPADGVKPLLQTIAAAQKSIDLMIFRFDRREIETALIKAASRGVFVHALIASTNRGGDKGLRELEARLLAAGVTVARTADDLVRNLAGLPLHLAFWDKGTDGQAFMRYYDSTGWAKPRPPAGRPSGSTPSPPTPIAIWARSSGAGGTCRRPRTSAGRPCASSRTTATPSRVSAGLWFNGVNWTRGSSS